MIVGFMPEFCKQVLFEVVGLGEYAGILLPNGNVVAAGDGELLNGDDVEIIKYFDTWVDIAEEIVGDY